MFTYGSMFNTTCRVLMENAMCYIFAPVLLLLNVIYL